MSTRDGDRKLQREKANRNDKNESGEKWRREVEMRNVDEKWPREMGMMNGENKW